MSFQDDLLRYGPEAQGRASCDEARAYCAHLTATHYENFSVVTWLTPREHRPAFQSIYAFCRWSDDLGDEVGDPTRALQLLDWWRGELRAMYDGQARHPVMVALSETVERYKIPIEPFEALIDAFVQDQSITEYQTHEQLLDYCTRSANPVGHLVLHVAEAFTQENARLADMTCTALQLANFWQDVARDLAIGRIYLPRQDRDHFGYGDADLKALRFTPAFAALLRYKVGQARALLEEGRALVPRIAGALAVDVDLFSRGGLAILDRIEECGYDVLTARPALSKWTKVALLGRALVGLGLARLGHRRNPRQTARAVMEPPHPAFGHILPQGEGDNKPSPPGRRCRAAADEGLQADAEIEPPSSGLGPHSPRGRRNVATADEGQVQALAQAATAKSREREGPP
ncbi:MAG: squalene synthase HpnC [Isosphaeraceae bacterium]